MKLKAGYDTVPEARLSKAERARERASLDRGFLDQLDRFVASRKRVDDYRKDWQPRQADEWAIKIPPIINQATLEEAQTGRRLSSEQYEKACRDRQMLELQSVGIAARLKRAGISVYQDTISVLGLYSENFEEKTQYKNSNFIPSVQAKNTHDMLKSVQYWMDTTKSSTSRMWVFSYGWVPIYEYRDHHQKFTRWISKFSKHDLLKATQIEFVYYSIEGTVQTDEDGRKYINLHAHVLLKADRYLGKENWQILCDNVRAKAPKGYLHDSAIEKAAEVVKYCFKPAEFGMLSDDQLAHLYTVCKGLHFYTPLGSLKTFRSQLSESKLKLKHIESDNGPTWCVVKARERSKLEDVEEETAEATGSAPNTICGITAPAPTFSEIYEPSLIIRNFDGNIEGLLASNPWIEERMASIKRTVERQQDRLRRLEIMRARIREQARFPSIRDTTTITVPETLFDEAEIWHPPPDFDDGVTSSGWA